MFYAGLPLLRPALEDRRRVLLARVVLAPAIPVEIVRLPRLFCEIYTVQSSVSQVAFEAPLTEPSCGFVSPISRTVMQIKIFDVAALC